MRPDSTKPILKILERLQVPILIANPVTAEILWVNSHIVRMAEASSAEAIIGSSLFDYIEAHQVGKALADLAKVALRKNPPPFTYHLRKSTGEYAAAQVASMPLMFDSQLAMLSVVTDVSEREQLLADLEQSEERYRVLLEMLPIPFAVEVESRFVYANAAMQALLCAETPEEVVGHPVDELIAESDRRQARDRRREVILGANTTVTSRMTLNRCGGGQVSVSALMNRIRWDGMPATQMVLHVLDEAS